MIPTFLNRFFVLSGCFLISFFSQGAIGQEPASFKMKELHGGIQVARDDQVVADYLTKSISKPIIRTLIGPTGAKMTRDYPMVKDSENEAHDHPHHRSLWFTYGEVNDVDFWLEAKVKEGLRSTCNSRKDRQANKRLSVHAIFGSDRVH